jgi:ATP-dependent RNA helicase RhlE
MTQESTTTESGTTTRETTDEAADEAGTEGARSPGTAAAEQGAATPEEGTAGAERADPTPDGEPATFRELGLSDRLLQAIARTGYERPTTVQRRAIPPALAGKDVLGSAQTGTGKTAAFTLPMLQRFDSAEQGTLRGLVVTPTRELAQQVEEAVRTYGATSGIESMVIHGGVAYGPQIEGLEWGCDVLVATPGRLLDLCRKGIADLSAVQVLVLDEADRMLDMGFIDDIRKIVAQTPDERQTLLFSATMPNAILSLAHEMMRDPVRVQVGLETAAEGIREVIHPVDRSRKHELLLHYLEEEAAGQVLVFTRTRNTTSYLCNFLEGRGVSADDLHGGKSQDQRTRSLRRFRADETRVLVATNVAARGLDIRGIRHVVNFDVPEDPRDYVHRVGRTARADETGDAVTLMSPHEWLLVREIEKLTGVAIERETVEGFEPSVEPLGAREETSADSGVEERSRSRLGRGRRRRG